MFLIIAAKLSITFESDVQVINVYVACARMEAYVVIIH